VTHTLWHTYCDTHTVTHTLWHTHCDTHTVTHTVTHTLWHTLEHTLYHTQTDTYAHRLYQTHIIALTHKCTHTHTHTYLFSWLEKSSCICKEARFETSIQRAHSWGQFHQPSKSGLCERRFQKSKKDWQLDCLFVLSRSSSVKLLVECWWNWHSVTIAWAQYESSR